MLTGLAVTFIGVTWSNSGLFSTPAFIVSLVRKRVRGGGEQSKKRRKKKEKERGKRGIEKGR